MEHRVVHYHYPLDKRYSLEYVDDDATQFAERYGGYDSGTVKALGYPIGEAEIYCLYTQTGESGTADDLETSETEIVAALDDMHPDRERPIAIGLFEAWEGVREEAEETGDGLEIYKELELSRVPEALDEVNWNGTATNVAGELMSNLILRHVLPNANHRSSISMLQIYLDFCTFGREVEYNGLRLHTADNEWRAWVDPYITQSKRILTVRRNNVRFQKLSEYGVETVIRKGGIEIALGEWNLGMHYRDAWTHYARKHEQLCVLFAEEIAERAGVPELSERAGLSQADFASLLAGHEP
ncbi:hypothetical protein [Haladaptatus sp. CMSO5]|uniref:hypothetical protein n=1 Tax=Haladaptatus sp. CMSO5 TaxID=3120514 RepID=UPI002FCE4A0B